MTRKKIIRVARVFKLKRKHAKDTDLFFPRAMMTKLRDVEHVGVVSQQQLSVIEIVYDSIL